MLIFPYELMGGIRQIQRFMCGHPLNRLAHAFFHPCSHLTSAIQTFHLATKLLAIMATILQNFEN